MGKIIEVAGREIIKPINYQGQQLVGKWQVTYKIDGVRAIIVGGRAYSRAGKPLYNLAKIPSGDYEIFYGDWKSSITAVRSQSGQPLVHEDFAYRLDNNVDSRLFWCEIMAPSKIAMDNLLKLAVERGYEGIVVRQGKRWLKHKPVKTYDVPVIGIQKGTGKHLGRMGALLTPMGKVGTGFSDAEREELMNIKLGTFIEVKCMELTDKGKFRHPSFVRVRYDKGIGGN